MTGQQLDPWGREWCTKDDHGIPARAPNAAHAHMPGGPAVVFPREQRRPRPWVPTFVMLVATLTTWYAFYGAPYGWRGPWVMVTWAWAASLFAALAWSR